MALDLKWRVGLSIVGFALLALRRSRGRAEVSSPEGCETGTHACEGEFESMIDEASAESFPASDPPARTLITGVGRRA